ncbi:MAG TPA: hypothetical protein DCP28_08185 [Cytophagales bacterium]|nr:hypothetical protein [Cytophagales bacterium]
MTNGSDCTPSSKPTAEGAEETAWQLSKEITVYPNPNSGSFRVSCDCTLDGPVTITLFNAVGQEVYHYSGELSGAVHDVDLESPSSGVYYLHFTTSTDRYIQKLVIE